jgi:hypothetical protein
LGIKLANKATQLDWNLVMGIFTRSIANMTSGKGGGEGYERMLLDSIIMYIGYLTSVFRSFTRSTSYYGYSGKGGMDKSRLLDCILICIANWTLDSSIGQFYKRYCLLNLNYLYCPGGMPN